MKDVVLHHPNWEMHCPNSTIEKVAIMPVVANAYDDDLSIEAIPEKLTDEERTVQQDELKDWFGVQ